MSDSAQQAKAQKKAYDEACKRVLSERGIMAHILKACTEEFKDCDLQDIAQRYIQGEPSISRIAVEPEAISPRIESEQTEDKSGAEGTVYYDIRFHAVAPIDGKRIQLIINLEAQNDFNPGYPLLKRAVYYCGRMISSQYGTVFVKSHYEKIQKVYSIWICMNMEENTMSHIHLTKEDLIGSYEWKGNLDLLNIIMIGLAKELPEHDETYELHRLLGALLSRELTIDEKLDIIGNEYDIPLEENFRKDMSTMCNLSQGVKEEGIAIGRREGLEEGRREGHAELITKMYKNGLSIEQIASATDKTVEEVRAIIEGKEKSQEA